MFSRRFSLTNRMPLGVFALIALAIAPAIPSVSAAQAQAVIAGNHADEAAELTGGEIQGSRALRIEVSMALRNRDQLEDLITQQQDPSSPLYHHWLTRRSSAIVSDPLLKMPRRSRGG